ncbi:MAG: sodium:calcium antiporter, partial [Gemmatimonadetes bacterium]|nr:sodium:calcium antiporter [Gemmatimonadota bacterium]
DGRIGRLDGVVLFAGIVVYTAFSIAQSRKASAAVRAEYREAYGAQRPRGLGLLLNLGLVLGGLALLLVGAHWLVDSAVAAARRIGVSELIVGLTIVAAGTSLPEVAASLVAAVRGERDIAAGNVIGSNIFNILSILGISAVVADGGLPIDPALLRFDVPVMIAVAIATLPICFTGYRISRWEGLLFLGYYLAYTLYLILKAAEHDALYAYSAVMLFFVVPLTAATIAVLVFRALKARYAP